MWWRIARRGLEVGQSTGCARSGRATSGPDQDLAVFFHRDPLPVDQLGFEIGEILVIQLELALQRPIGEPAAPLEHGNRLVKNCVEVHSYPSASSANSAFASCKSLVSNPSVNQ